MTGPASPPGPPGPRARALQATIVALLALLLVQASAFLSAATFDALPTFLDVLLVLFGFPFLVFLGILLFDARVLTPLFRGRWLQRADGHEAQLPALLGPAILAACLAGIYPGMFPYRTYLQLRLDGAALDVEATAAAPPGAGYYRFSDATVRADLAGSTKRKVVVRRSGIHETILVATHAAPIVDAGWTRADPVHFWAVTEEEVSAWTRAPVQGLRAPDERGHARRAVEGTAALHELLLAPEPILVELGEPWEVELARSGSRARLVLFPLGLLVFVATWWATHRELGRS